MINEGYLDTTFHKAHKFICYVLNFGCLLFFLNRDKAYLYILSNHNVLKEISPY